MFFKNLQNTQNLHKVHNIQTVSNSQANLLQIAPPRNILFNGNMNERRINYGMIPNVGRGIPQDQINRQGLVNNF